MAAACVRTGLLVGLLAGGAIGCGAVPDEEPLPAEAREAVVLVHGLGRSPLSMAALEHDFEGAGYQVLNWGYSSYCCTVAELADRLASDLEAWRADAQVIHFVGHSLGGIIIRRLLAERPSLPAGRVVMLAPPNQGSASADRYADWLGSVLAPLPELRTDSAGALVLPPPGVPVGIIAADRDGKVSVAETRLEGAAAHIVVPGVHSFIMMRPDARVLARRFVRTGRFAE